MDGAFHKISRGKKMKTLFALFALIAVLTISSETFAASSDFKKGLRYYGKKDYRNTAVYLKKHVSDVPDPIAYYLLGYADYKMRRFDEANKYFTEAYLIDP